MQQNRKVERRTILKAGGASLAALGLGTTATACGGGSGAGDGTVTIRYAWWGAEDRAKRINETVKLFEKKYPKIKVKMDFQVYTDFWKKFNTQASGGNPPDVFPVTPARTTSCISTTSTCARTARRSSPRTVSASPKRI
jgi:multiple sugar transport system substrate-binding protein